MAVHGIARGSVRVMHTATAIWRISPELVQAIDAGLGVPVDSYVNGSQTWFTGEPALEWRLHPSAGYRPPAGLSPYDLWESVTAALTRGTEATALPLAGEVRALAEIWDGLECFPAYGDELEPATVVRRAAEHLTLSPDASGLVDHTTVGDAWESSEGAVSIITLLERQLAG
jgi:hypothetical protein